VRGANGEEEGRTTATRVNAEAEVAVAQLLAVTQDLSSRLERAALSAAASFVAKERRDGEGVLSALTEAAALGDESKLAAAKGELAEYADAAEDTAKLIRHIVVDDVLGARVQHALQNMRVYAPQVATAANVLCAEPASKAARLNLDHFCSFWRFLIVEVTEVTRRTLADYGFREEEDFLPFIVRPPVILKEPPTPGATEGHQPPSFNVMLSRNHFGKFHASVPNLAEAVDQQQQQLLQQQQQQRMLNVPQQQQQPYDHSRLMPHPHLSELRRHSTSSMFYPSEDPLAAFANLEDTNEIVRRARKMASQARDMLAFTAKSSANKRPTVFGPTAGLSKNSTYNKRVRTTQDLLTLGEYLSEEANALYKVVRLFSYDLPLCEDKRALMAAADGIPKHCHRLKSLIQAPAVGRAATFDKVDDVVKEAKVAASLAAAVARACYLNAEKYDLDFSRVSADAGDGHCGSSSSGLNSSGGESS